MDAIISKDGVIKDRMKRVRRGSVITIPFHYELEINGGRVERTAMIEVRFE